MTEAASAIVCSFAFTYLNSAHVIITSSDIKYWFIIVAVIQKITLLHFFHGDQDLIKTVLIYICS